MIAISYSSVIENLMYTIVFTRPNIAHIVGVVSHFSANPRKEIGKLSSGFLDI